MRSVRNRQTPYKSAPDKSAVRLYRSRQSSPCSPNPILGSRFRVLLRQTHPLLSPNPCLLFLSPFFPKRVQRPSSLFDGITVIGALITHRRHHPGGHGIKPLRPDRVPVSKRSNKARCDNGSTKNGSSKEIVLRGFVSGELILREICFDEAHLREVRSRQVRPRQVRPSQASPGKVRPVEIGPPQIGSKEVSLDEARCHEIGPGQVCPGQIGPTEVRIEQVSPAEVLTAEIAGTVDHHRGNLTIKSDECRTHVRSGRCPGVPNFVQHEPSVVSTIRGAAEALFRENTVWLPEWLLAAFRPPV